MNAKLTLQGKSLALCLLVLGTAGKALALQTAQENLRCLNCHGQHAIVDYSAEQRATMVSPPATQPRDDTRSLYFNLEVFARSSHANLRCSDCHVGAADKLPHPGTLPPPNCAQCHPIQAALFAKGVHARDSHSPDRPSPSCVTCHGSHDILPPANRASRIYPLNVLRICGGCHEKHTDSFFRDRSRPGDSGSTLMRHYLESVHGKAVTESGLVTAATCPDCHGAHEIYPSQEAESTVNRTHVAETCGRCHVGVAEQFADGIHSRLRQQPEFADRVPVCNNCHTSHEIARPDGEAFAIDIVEECGHCHQDLYATYRESYHGQVNRLGLRRAARCSDCHGAHAVRGMHEDDSATLARRRIEMCAKCHPGANANFAKFDPHANFRSHERDPLLFYVWMYFMIVITTTFSFFGLHTVLWWVRSIIERVKHGPHRHAPAKKAYRRFAKINRVTHALVIVSFMGLTLTGIPLKFNDQPWAMWLTRLVGGVNTAGILHRIFAVVMAVYLCIHIRVILGWFAQKIRSGEKGWLFGPESLLPRWKDLADMIGMIRWFFGLGPKPKFDRWTYWEKFDYWADWVGTVLIGGSGLLLAFPIVASWILPGWMFNVAMIVHGYEALLAIGFIFTMHFFNAHLRLEKFPADTVIFTGQVTEEEMKEERTLEYERLEREGRLEEFEVKPESTRALKWATRLGTALLILGTVMVALIIWAGVGGLLGISR